jgi:TonB family protein
MKNKDIRTWIFSSAGIILLSLLGAACNDNNSTGKTDKSAVVEKDTTAAAPVAKTKKKGKVTADVAASGSKEAKVKKDKDGVYVTPEVMPAYPGNNQALSDYISTNLQYPEQAIDNNVEGTVQVQFVVDKNGSISDVKTVGNKLGYGLDEEAVTVVSKLPKWTPGKVNGKNVKTRMTIPITYKLES